MKYLNKILFIGSIQWGQQSTGGGIQTKNQLLLRYLENRIKEIELYDTYNKNAISVLIHSLILILRNNKNTPVIFSIAFRGSYTIVLACKLMGLQRNFYLIAPGGNLNTYLRRSSSFKQRIFKSFEKIYVQAYYLQKDLMEMGFENCSILSNFKPIIYTPNKTKERKNIFKFVYLSRITADKGVEEIIEAVKILNRKDVCVDFYGKILEPYTDSFFDNLQNLNIYYKGFLDLNKEDGYKLLSDYDALLFPTYFNGEGFPGTLIDSFIAGVPAIATRFHANEEIIKDGENGLLIPIKDAKELSNAMLMLIDNHSVVEKLRKGAIESAKKYDINSVLDNLLQDINIKNV